MDKFRDDLEVVGCIESLFELIQYFWCKLTAHPHEQSEMDNKQRWTINKNWATYSMVLMPCAPKAARTVSGSRTKSDDPLVVSASQNHTWKVKRHTNGISLRDDAGIFHTLRSGNLFHALPVFREHWHKHG